MLYLIGLGLDENGISKEAAEEVKKCKKIYLDGYTIEFPYPVKKLEKIVDKKIFPADRGFVESLKILQEAAKINVALLIYGSPLFATTHISLIQEAKKRKIGYKIFYNASVFDAIAETGLQLYKFGKITSLPIFEAKSYIKTIKENLSIKAHSLILVDIGMDFNTALKRIENDLNENGLNTNKIVVCSGLGTKNSKIYYEKTEKLRNKNVKAPFCFIIPGELHFLEREFLESLD